MMSVLIDPYMFELSDAQEIKNNISFFMKMLKLCNKSDDDEKLRIAIYKGMLKRICQRTIQPFPINIQAITDSDLKNTILQINKSFNHALLESIESIDIDECSGEQEFKIIDENGIAEDDSYYEMFCMLLIPCYSKHEDIDDRILTGIKKDGRQIGDHFQIQCSCFDYNYIKQCMFSGIDEFISDKEKVIEFLKEKKRKKEITIVDIVSAEIGEHHNHVQADGKKFSTLSELSIKNKKVLKLFQNLGLFRIVFGRFTSQGVKAAGTMTIYSISKKNTQDIVTVKFNAETGFQIITDLYFPKGIGQLLQDYFKKNQITYKNMSELVDKI
ncbi:MAG: hypothetical protein HFJ08_06085 [Lachnospiraceae bacterium]|nr:hypothetical protein [Lachnospiraceae bacterium]MCI9398992.1 hypothetical protein [Lachnospiraceae bacterium]